MRIVLICLLTAAVMLSQNSSGEAGEGGAKSDSGLEKLLTTYLQNRLERARLALKHVQRLLDTGMASKPDVLAAEDVIDRWRLHLALAEEARLVTLHPVLSELRREFGVPEISKPLDANRNKLISTAIQEYLQRKIGRAEEAAERALALYDLRRGTESELFAAKSEVEGLELLLEVERANQRQSKE